MLRTFNRSVGIFTDASVVANASFQTVPGQLPYAGPAGTLLGFTVLSGEITIAPPYQITWTAVEIQLASGSVISYPGGSIGYSPAGGNAVVFYIYDPDYSGLRSAIHISQTSPTPGPGVMVLNTLPGSDVRTTITITVGDA